jgi:hypothetical protein
MDEDEYYYTGLSIAVSLVHGWPAPHILSQNLYTALAYGPPTTMVLVDDLPPCDVKELLKKVNINCPCSGSISYSDELSM